MAAALPALLSCREPEQAEQTARNVDVIDAVLLRVAGASRTEEPPLHLYATSLEGSPPLDLEVQAELAARFVDDDVVLRFVDTPEEALIGEDEETSIRNDGVLVRLGQVREAPDEMGLLVRVEVWTAPTEWRVADYRVDGRAEDWTVTTIQPIDDP